MAETMEQYMSKTRADYGSGVAWPKIDDKDHFELKGQFLKELRDNTFSGSDHEDANEHNKNVFEICPQHYLMEMQEVILFYNGLEVLTRQILDSKGAIPTKTAVDAKIAIQEIAEYPQKWHNGTSRTRSIETSDGLAAIQVQLNNLRREIKKVLENQLLSVSLLICLGKHDCVERIPLAEGDLRKFSDIGAWYAIEDCVQYDKKCSNPTSAISDETIAILNAQIVGNDMVRVQVPRCMTWLDYDEHVDSLSTMDNELGVIIPKSTTQTLPSFEEYTPLVTYLEEAEKTLGTFKRNKTRGRLLGKSVSLGVDISNLEMFDDDWGLESKEVSPLREELSLFDRPNKVERARILEAYRLESILQ
uniref:MAK10-like protein n=1 Tax=Tanacetum cinerariifolium TaxID=118510 RepID=A0A6L2KKH1_TANCI|nr:hypothetical protein [Tanacetum cinerariifolium]